MPIISVIESLYNAITNLRFIYGVFRDKFTFYNPETDKYESLKIENSKPRLEGICGVMRIYNEQEFIEAAILSVIDGLDELVVVLNKCTDNTPHITRSLADEYPDKIKIYNYDYETYTCLSKEHKSSSYNDPRNLANLYNYSFTRSNHKTVVKLDGDMLFDKKLFKEKCNLVRKSLTYKSLIYFFGLNTYRHNNQDFFFGDHLQCSYGDHCFYKLNKYIFYTKNQYFEYLTRNLVSNFRVFCENTKIKSQLKPLFLHVKLSKRCKGIAGFSQNRIAKKEYIHEKYKQIFPFRVEEDARKLKLLTLSDLEEKYPEYDNLKSLIDHEVLFFRKEL